MKRLLVKNQTFSETINWIDLDLESPTKDPLCSYQIFDDNSWILEVQYPPLDILPWRWNILYYRATKQGKLIDHAPKTLNA